MSEETERPRSLRFHPLLCQFLPEYLERTGTGLLRAWSHAHPKLGYDLLFAASSRALQDVAAHPRHLGGQLGMMGVLHTWSRTLMLDGGLCLCI